MRSRTRTGIAQAAALLVALVAAQAHAKTPKQANSEPEIGAATEVAISPLVVGFASPIAGVTGELLRIRNGRLQFSFATGTLVLDSMTASHIKNHSHPLPDRDFSVAIGVAGLGPSLGLATDGSTRLGLLWFPLSFVVWYPPRRGDTMTPANGYALTKVFLQQHLGSWFVELGVQAPLVWTDENRALFRGAPPIHGYLGFGVSL